MRFTGTPRFATHLPLALAAITIVAALLAGAPARAAEPETTDTLKKVVFVKETVVTGSRYPRAYYQSPQALSFVSRLQLREQLPTVNGDALQTLPGVDNSKDSPWEQRPVLRGLTGQRVLVLMDGSPMNSARGNGPHPSLVDPSQVERIEVVRGPSSVAYGSDALGGVINFITRQAQFTNPEQNFRGAASIGGSSADRQRNGYLELMPRAGKLSAFLSTGGRKAEDFHAPHVQVQNSAFSDYNALANLRYELSDHMNLKGGYQLYRGKDIGIPGLTTPTFAFSFPVYDRDAAHLTLEHVYPDHWLANTLFKAYWQKEHRNFFSHEDTPNFPPGGPPGAARRVTDQDRWFDLDTYGVQAQFTSVQTSLYRLSAGVDAARDHTDGDNVRNRTFYDASGAPLAPTSTLISASVPDGKFDNYGAYAQSEWFVNPQWTLNAGGRYTHYRYRTEAGVAQPPSRNFTARSVDDDALSGSLGLVYAPIADLHLTANVANGYRQPNAQDLFFDGPASVGYVLGNPGLSPEQSVSWDAGLRWGPGSLGLAANAFYSTYRNLIDALPLPDSIINGQQAYQYTNIAEARIWGLEAEGEWQFRPQWTGRAMVATSIGDITSREAIQELYGVDADQAPLPNVPPLKGSLGLRWRDGRDRFWVEPSARWSWRTNRLPLPQVGVPQTSQFKSEWIVGDIMAGARVFGRQRLVLGVKNFTNTPHQQALASLEEPGINVIGSLTADF
jgi:hemoglobin/transferrin/lactoferrin receptor protein